MQALTPFRLCSSCAEGYSMCADFLGSYAAPDFLLFCFPPFKRGESWGAPGVAPREASSPHARPWYSERGGSVSGRLSVARARLCPFSSLGSCREGGCSFAADAPCPRSFLGCLSLLIAARSATRLVERVFGGLLPFSILQCFPIFGSRNKEGSQCVLSVGQLS